MLVPPPKLSGVVAALWRPNVVGVAVATLLVVPVISTWLPACLLVRESLGLAENLRGDRAVSVGISAPVQRRPGSRVSLKCSPLCSRRLRKRRSHLGLPAKRRWLLCRKLSKLDWRCNRHQRLLSPPHLRRQYLLHLRYPLLLLHLPHHLPSLLLRLLGLLMRQLRKLQLHSKPRRQFPVRQQYRRRIWPTWAWECHKQRHKQHHKRHRSVLLK